MASYLVDTNILLRSADPASVGHSAAVHAVSVLLMRGEQVLITAQNLVEFWAVVTRPVEANGFGWKSQVASLQVRQLLDQFPLLEETSAVLTNWLSLVTRHGITGKRAHDARLVAVMRTHGISNLLTFNLADFQQYPDLALFHPEDIT